jgi:hypothetical protein
LGGGWQWRCDHVDNKAAHSFFGIKPATGNTACSRANMTDDVTQVAMTAC